MINRLVKMIKVTALGIFRMKRFLNELSEHLLRRPHRVRKPRHCGRSWRLGQGYGALGRARALIGPRARGCRRERLMVRRVVVLHGRDGRLKEVHPATGLIALKGLRSLPENFARSRLRLALGEHGAWLSRSEASE